MNMVGGVLENISQIKYFYLECRLFLILQYKSFSHLSLLNFLLNAGNTEENINCNN